MRRITQNIHIFMARCAHTYARILSVYAVVLLAGCTFINEDFGTPLNFSEIDSRVNSSEGILFSFIYIFDSIDFIYNKYPWRIG